MASHSDDFANVAYPRPAYAWYVVSVLLVAYIFAFIDREIMAIMVKDIEATLNISDTEMSLLLGGAFAIFYTLCGTAIAWLADRGNRRILIICGVAVWSVMTCSCGVATAYWPLFLSRVGVGAGEGALNPPALSLIKDYFPPHRIGRALGLYSAGVSAGAGLAYLLGGTLYGYLKRTGVQSFPLVGALEPWQQMFFIVGLPGLVVALWLTTIREPVRRESLGEVAAAAPATLLQTLTFVGARWRAFVVLFLALSVMAIMAYGIGFWIPESLRRSYHLSDQEFSHWLQVRGVMNMLFGFIGVIAGGLLADHLQKKYDDGYVRVCIIAFVFMAVGYVGFTLMPTPGLAVLMLAPAFIGGGAPTAAGSAAVVSLAPARMRAQIVALYYFTLNVVGFMVGPTAVALLTDHYFHDRNMLRWSLCIVAAAAIALGTFALLWCRPHFRAAIAESENRS